MQEVFNFTRGEIAVMCVLLLRGPQTPGELRGRTERMHRFEGAERCAAALQRLMQREPPLAMVLPRQPGTKGSSVCPSFVGRGDGSSAEPGRNSLKPARSRSRSVAPGSIGAANPGGEATAVGGVNPQR